MEFPRFCDWRCFTSAEDGSCILDLVASSMERRGYDHKKVFGVRLALGARKWRLTRQLLAENLPLLPVAVGLGLAIAELGGRWVTSAISYENRGYLPNYGRVYMDYAPSSMPQESHCSACCCFLSLPFWKTASSTSQVCLKNLQNRQA